MELYVGTYHKYNSGSLAGKWLDLDDFSDKDEFIQACYKLHKDEEDPELMFQDWSGESYEKQFYGESWVPENYWQIKDLCENEEDREAFLEYCDHFGDEPDHEAYQRYRDRYVGSYESDREFAEEFAEQTGSLMEHEPWPYNYIEWEAATNDIMQSYTEIGGRYYADQ